MKTPFLSVLIPTKGRSFLIPNAVRSVLQQTFTDFEVVLIDNDDGDATRRSVEGVKDPRFRYVRSGGRSMPDNWDFAFDQARADYICLIEDKQAFKRHALERVAAELEKHRPQSVRWMNDLFDDARKTPRVWQAKGDRTASFVSSDEILQKFLHRPRREYAKWLPIPHFGCIHRSLLNTIKSGPMGRLCPPVSPDYTLAFLQLAYVEAVLHIQESLVVFVTNKHSNGQASIQKLPQAKQFTKELGGKESVFFDLVPVKARTIPGSIYNDYLHVQQKVGERLARHPLHWPTYFAECYRAMQYAVSLGTEMSAELREWHRAMSEQPESVREETSRMIQTFGGGSWLSRTLKAAGKSMAFPQMEFEVKAFIRKRITRDPAWQHADAMSYIDADFERRGGSSVQGGERP